MKYVILQQALDGYTKIYPLIFSEHQTHVVMAAAVIVAEERESKSKLAPLTAGRCWINAATGEWNCEHGSTSMSMKKDPALDLLDANLLNLPEAMQGIILSD